ncbi:hypothetical protein SAMN05216229_11646 [Geopseudomonas sagittaria]|uniref:DUF7281 domain-containing protein n=1 Tax=Geopseudomonas sagittaria TaxID=1135990 RepID=A0A1I5XG66_9GAMM|nr:hypothetical protein [Pseudomonas sagittaria]MCM2329692.1 hypothetical protein [Pseudomonas sagittaria]SFQ30950.1 hypothetical protein SAMN05216229_11646 [Pseudomonas sagittaria]
MSRALADALGKLLVAGELAISHCTLAQRQALDDFARKTGFVRLTTRGRGSLYQIVGRERVEAHLAQLRPRQQEALPADLPSRALNVARYRDSKRGSAGHAVHYLLLKAVGAEVRWRDGQEAVVELSALTRLCGAAALAVQSGDGWHCDEPLWLVENQALFDDPSWLPADAGGALCYYSGQLSSLMLDWLAAQPRAPQVILFPDYDGIGLQNFARLRERLGGGCELWLIPGWSERLRQYGNRRIWLDNLANFQDAVRRLSIDGMPAAVAELCRTMQAEGLALEQESVFLGEP